MFCDRPLGAKQVIEHFPVGRRLAVEMCERLFRDTRVRVSTENVGLTKHPEGLEFVRIASQRTSLHRPSDRPWFTGAGRNPAGAQQEVLL